MTETFLEKGSSSGRDAIAALLGLAGTAIAALSFSLDMYGGAPGLGRGELLLLSVSTGLFGGAAAARFSQRDRFGELYSFGVVSLQLLLLAFILARYEILDETFHRFVLGLTVAGFFGNYFLPMAARPAFFLALSFVAMFGVLGPVLGLLTLIIGTAIVALCHLPISLWIRAVLLLAVAVFFGVVQTERDSFPLLAGLLPILPSIFMFRLVIYLYDARHDKIPTDWPSRLSYFFMLPNFVFPFYPVVDSSEWRRSYYAGPELEIYQAGVRWIFYGIIHLLLYRFVNYYLPADPAQVDGFVSFLIYATLNFALYLKVSGLFHLILGMLHLFGHRLPETHSRYYLSFSFIEFWRRINIYWKDFMQKMVFNPVFAWVRARGLRHMQAVVTAIAAVFFVTWALHAYQWFWLRGGLFLNLPDTLFWGLLGILLIVQTVEESRPPRKGVRALIGPTTLRVIRTAAMMTLLVILWAMWSSASLTEWTALLATAGFTVLDPNIDITVAGVLQSLAFAGFLFVLAAISTGYTFGLAPRGSHPTPRKTLNRIPDSRTAVGPQVLIVAVSLVLLAPTLPTLTAALPRTAQIYLTDMQRARLSALDQERLDRGYYENLTGISFTNSELWNYRQTVPANWKFINKTAIAREVDDYRAYDLIPNMTISHRGSLLSTNAHGMHDHDYSVAKPEGTLRIAIVGASRAMGTGVEMRQTFENLIEDEMNATLPVPVEILNFSVDGYDGARKLMQLEQKTAEFKPDVVVMVTHELDPSVLWRFSTQVGRVPMPYPYMDKVIEQASITDGMSRDEIVRRAGPFKTAFAEGLYATFLDICKKIGATPIVTYLPSIDTDFEASAVETMRDAVRKSGVSFIDLKGIFEGIDKSTITIAPWDDHPNSRGHQIIARALFDKLMVMPEFQARLGGL